MGLFNKFFGVIEPYTGAPVLAAIYAILGLVFMILSAGRWIMPHAESDLSIPWAVVCFLLLLTGVYGYWATTRGSTWHHRQFVSASWGFLLMFLCWAIVYIAVEDHHVEKVNDGCMAHNPSWGLKKCDDRRKTASLIATILVTIGMVLGFYLTLVVSKWVTAIEWAEHLEEERRLEEYRSGHTQEKFAIQAEEAV
ncbi:hypothetical protein EMPS_06973 [Entomortierella parvispora]|uniref:Uncharacterized protein n=1 Tax=Entomortierella parvispora TaxID=205924 RepID=A0A9P3HDM3_9FUNG|nr:hypothetical protein EMPS_06973 [Entomortierella parvispora]